MIKRTLDELLAMPMPKKKPPAPKPVAEVVAYPKGGQLAIAKAGRTRKEDLVDVAGHNMRLIARLRAEREREPLDPFCRGTDWGTPRPAYDGFHSRED
jgi:hypothetical protein